MSGAGGERTGRVSARSRRWLFRLLAAVAGVAAGALAGEVALRALDAASGGDEAARLSRWVDRRRDPPPVTGPCRGQADQARLGDLLVPVAGSEALYRLAPGLDTCFEGARLTTDARGLRIAAGGDSNGPPPSAARILWMGDSQAFGWGLEAADSPSVLLERALGELVGSDRQRAGVAVLNGAVPGYNAAQEAALLAELGPELAPRCVVVAFSANDLALPVVVPRERVRSRSLLWRELRQRWGNGKWLRYAGAELVDHLSDAELDRLPAELRRTVGVEGYRRALASMARTGAAIDAPVVTVATYARAALERTEILRDLELLGIAHLDLSWPVGPEWRLSATDPHPNRAANARLARKIARRLVEKGLCGVTGGG